VIDLNVTVSGQEAIATTLGVMPQALRVRMVQALAELGTEMGARARAGAPSRTGALRNSINVKVTEARNSVKATVGTSQFYSRFVEGGTKNSAVRVRGYVRHVSSADVHTLIGKSGRRLKNARLVKVGVGVVKDYVRQSHLKAHPFMRPAFESMKDRIEMRINAAIAGAIEGSNG
jgi:HK97 gp10 family phage protein